MKVYRGYQDLIVWQKSMDLVDEIYKLVKFLPKEENFALSDQMRRSCVSIPSNIAECYERNSIKEFIQFLSIAKGSRAELETQLLICIRQKYLNEEQIQKSMLLCEEIRKMLKTIIDKKIAEIK